MLQEADYSGAMAFIQMMSCSAGNGILLERTIRTVVAEYAPCLSAGGRFLGRIRIYKLRIHANHVTFFFDSGTTRILRQMFYLQQPIDVAAIFNFSTVRVLLPARRPFTTHEQLAQMHYRS